MKRLTRYISGYAHGAEGVTEQTLTGHYCRGVYEATAVTERLAKYEDMHEQLEQRLSDIQSSPGCTDDRKKQMIEDFKWVLSLINEDKGLM